MPSSRRLALALAGLALASCAQILGLSSLEPDEGDASNGGGLITGGSSQGGGGRGGSGGGGGGDAGSDNEGGDGPSGGTAGTAGSAGSSGGGSGGNAGEGAAGEGAGGEPGCTELTGAVLAEIDARPEEGNTYFYLTFSPELGSGSSDEVALEFFDGESYDGSSTGTFTLGAGPNDDNYATCSRCVLVRQDNNSTYYFATSGTMEIADASLQMEGQPQIVLNDVTLIEVTIDTETFASTPVPGGACLHLGSAELRWDCDPTQHGDANCDCGCGSLDPGCSSPTDACNQCHCVGDGCDPANNVQCL